MKAIVNSKSVSNVRKTVFFALCLFLYIHNGVSLQAQSFSQVKELAESGNIEAQYLLGNMYENGKGCDKDIQKAIIWYEKSLANGNKHVAPHLAIAYHIVNEHSKAYPLFLSFVESPDNLHVDEGMYGISQFFIGYYYLTGSGVPKNEEKAVAWFERAKENGDDNAFILLGHCYLKGIGTPKNPTKSFNLYKDGYEIFKDRQEFAVKLAMCYMEGYGCNQDFSMVYPLIEKIADGSLCNLDEDWKCTAQLILGVTYYKDANKEDHWNKAFHWLTKVAESNYGVNKTKVSALYWLQRCYRFGRGVEQDVDKANEIVRNNPSSDGDVPNLVELLETK